MIKNVKTLIGIEGSDQDNLLNLLIDTATNKVLSRLRYLDDDIQFIPAELEYIVVELSVIRYNKIGSEGMAQETVEGHSATYTSDDISNYDEEIQRYIDNKKGHSLNKKVVRFL